MGIIKELQNDLDNAAVRVVGEYRARLHAAAVKLCGDASEADDLVMRTFDAAFRDTKSYDATKGELYPWLIGVMRRIYAKTDRRLVNRGTVPVDPVSLQDLAGISEESVDKILEHSDHDALREAMDRLDPEYKKVLVMHYFGELPVKQIATVMNVPVGTVLWRLNIARKILARDLGAKLGKKPLALLLAALLGVGTLFGAWVSPLGDWVAEKVFGSAPAEVTQVDIEPAGEERGALATAPQADTNVISETQKQEGEDSVNISAKIQKTVAAASLVAMGLVGSASAATYHVATTGSDETGDGTEGNPYRTIAAAIAVADADVVGGGESATVLVANGTYTESNLALTNAVTVRSESGNRESVIVQANEAICGANHRRVFRVAHSGAALESITVRNGYFTTAGGFNGGNILLTAGVVTNCVITGGHVEHTQDSDIAGALGGNLYQTGGLAVDCDISKGNIYNANGAGGGCNVVLHGSGRLMRCKVSGGYRTSGNIHSQWASQSGGSGVYLNGGSCVIENCLVSGNSGAVSALVLRNRAKAVNCTVAGNGEAAGKGGIWIADDSESSVINCLCYANGGTAEKEWGNAKSSRFVNCAVPSAAVGSGSFVAVGSGDVEVGTGYRQTLNSVLLGAGSVDAYASVAVSTTDFSGASRIADGVIDIGCYQVCGLPSCKVVASSRGVGLGRAITFSATNVINVDDDVSFVWDFGDGETCTVTTDSVVHVYSSIGSYEVAVTLRGGGKDLYVGKLDRSIRIVPADVYVNAASTTAVEPYATPATAAASFLAALNTLSFDGDENVLADGVTVHVAPGTYVENARVSNPRFALIGSVRIVGEGASRDDVVIDAGANEGSLVGRAFTLKNEGAELRHLTVRGGVVYGKSYEWGDGGNVWMSAGTVRDCVLTDGSTAKRETVVTRGGNIFLSGGQVIDCAITGGGRHKISMTYDVYGGNVGMTGGRVSRCVISGGIGCTWDSEWGNNVYALGGVVENCLIKDGTDGDAAVYLGGDAKLVNCTVVNNKCYSGAKRKGVYASSSDVRVVDVLVYNNGGGKVSEWAEVNGASFVHCATVANAAITGGEGNVEVTAAAFEDVAGGAYRPVKGGALHEAGVSMERYRSFGATSLRDASRKPRLTGSLIDIGCYERYVPAIAVSIR